MFPIRQAQDGDLERIAEIEIFNYRLNFYPIFLSDIFYFDELRVSRRVQYYQPKLQTLWVYDDGVVKGFLQCEGDEIKKLFVEPVLQRHSIGGQLVDFAINQLHARTLWALEKNSRAIAFYQRHGFRQTADKKLEEDTEEYLVRLER